MNSQGGVYACNSVYMQIEIFHPLSGYLRQENLFVIKIVMSIMQNECR